jgi:hypothetical protein
MGQKGVIVRPRRGCGAVGGIMQIVQMLGTSCEVQKPLLAGSCKVECKHWIVRIFMR